MPFEASEPSGPQGLGDLPSGVLRGRTSIEPLRRLPSQLDVVDDLLDGGLPRGRVSELVGPQSSGKTSLLIAFLAAATRRSEVTAYVDLADSLSPASFAAAGVDLEHLLWVRPHSLKDAVRCAEIILQAGGFAAVALDLSDRSSVIGRSWLAEQPRATQRERSRHKTLSAASGRDWRAPLSSRMPHSSFSRRTASPAASPPLVSRRTHVLSGASHLPSPISRLPSFLCGRCSTASMLP
jgi:hypothetical protein